MLIKSKKIFYKDWIYSWLIEKKDYIKESTYANYSNNIFNHIIPNLGDYTLNELNHKIIQDFLLELSKNGKRNGSGGLSEKTIKDITIIVKGSIKKGINEDKIKHIELTFNYPKENKDKSIYILSKHEQNKLTDYVINNLTSRNIGILLSLYSGIRIGELCSLQWKDIDFKNNKISNCEKDLKFIKGEYNFSNMNSLFSENITRDLIEGIESFNNKILGFTDKNAYVLGVESRSSSPVRIIRDNNLISNIKGIYPCGEGAGYAGGITTSAMDGIKVAEVIGNAIIKDF